MILDASAHLPASGRDAQAEFTNAHIPGARFLDLGSLIDTTSDIPAALPRADQFAARIRTLGIRSRDRIVLYDDSALRSSARARFIFRMFGFADVVDSGWRMASQWKVSGYSIAHGPTQIVPSEYPETCADQLHGSAAKPISTPTFTVAMAIIIDARDAGRFTGAIEDRVHGLPGGHIPGARNIPFTSLFDDEGCYKSPRELRVLFDEAGAGASDRVIASCGSGMTACTLIVALELLGREAALYDGSWAEWGADPATEKERGAGIQHGA